MRNHLIAAFVALALGAGAALSDAAGADAYEMLFRTGTLDELEPGTALVYSREVVNGLTPDSGPRETGTITLMRDAADRDSVLLSFSQGERGRALGSFPADVGNPMVMYFLETVIRDMADAAGGSPFYIRNRMKEAMMRSARVEDLEASFEGRAVRARSLTLRPFEDDPNRDRMRGFADLAVTVTMSEAVPGWYSRLEARVPGGTDGADPIYAATVTLDAMEAQR